MRIIFCKISICFFALIAVPNIFTVVPSNPLSAYYEIQYLQGGVYVQSHSFIDSLKQKPALEVHLEGTGGQYADCNIKFYPWGRGSLIKIEGVNIVGMSSDVRLIIENFTEIKCNPCRNGYLFAVVFSQISSSELNRRNTRVYLKKDGRIIAEKKNAGKKP